MTARDAWAAGLSWTDVPTHLLRAELLRRQEQDGEDDAPPACGTKGGKGTYNTPLHVAALIIILVLSTVACSFPLVVKHFPNLRVPHKFLFLSRHFGTGVLIATAFVHLLPTAFASLTDPCLPSFWNKGYPAMPGFVAMVSVFIVVGIEMFFASKGAGHVHATDYEPFGSDDPSFSRPGHKRSNSFGRFRGVNGHVPDIVLHHMDESDRENLMAGRSPSVQASRSPAHPSSPSQSSSNKPKYRDDDDDSDLDLDLDELGPPGADASADSLLSRPPTRKVVLNSHPHDHNHNHSRHDSHSADPSELTEAQHKKLLLQCLLLEAGILFHSVFIGMALSVATGTSFLVLLVAISFHQTFEGLALGSRISAVRFEPNSVKPWLMALAYGTTTPIGQVIGLLIHNLYDPASQTGLLTVGVMNAISSGLLLFAGLVELLAEDFLSDESYQVLRGRRRLEACGSVVAGAALMALVGAWA